MPSPDGFPIGTSKKPAVLTPNSCSTASTAMFSTSAPHARWIGFAREPEPHPTGVLTSVRHDFSCKRPNNKFIGSFQGIRATMLSMRTSLFLLALVGFGLQLHAQAVP